MNVRVVTAARYRKRGESLAAFHHLVDESGGRTVCGRDTSGPYFGEHACWQIQEFLDTERACRSCTRILQNQLTVEVTR